MCAWIGNSRLIARKHYLQVTEEHFEQAALIGTQAAQNQAQQPAVSGRTDTQGDFGGTEDQQELQGVATKCESVQVFPVGGTGFEPVTSCVSSTRSSQLS